PSRSSPSPWRRRRRRNGGGPPRYQRAFGAGGMGVGYVAPLKGAMSEAELHPLRQRLHDGLLSKARKGEVYSHPPTGYVKGPAGAFALDPDEQAQGVVRLLFEQFVRQGTVCGLLRYLVRHQIRLPVRPHSGPQRGQLQWHPPNRVTLQSL